MFQLIFLFNVVNYFSLIIEKIKRIPRVVGMKVKFMGINENAINVPLFAFNWCKENLFASKMNIGKGGV